jgi:hypothetical protein
MNDHPSDSAESVAKGDDRLDREFRQSYFRQLVGQFRTLGPSASEPEARKIGDQIAALKPESVDWNDIYQLELAIIKLEPEPNLRRRAWSLRAEYKKIAPKDYEQYESTSPPDPANANVEVLRADLIHVQEELNWYYTVLWVQENFRSLLLARITQRTAIYILYYFLAGVLVGLSAFVGGYFLSDKDVGSDGPQAYAGTNATNLAMGAAGGQLSDTNGLPSMLTGSLGATRATNSTNSQVLSRNMLTNERPSRLRSGAQALADTIPIFGTYWLVVFAGTLGALISVLRRIQGMTLEDNPDLNLVQLGRSSASIYYSPLLGAVFALLLLFLFMSGLLSGSLFPTSPHNGEHAFLGCVPSGCVDLAKLAIWCFIAGFAEKFVPDALDRLQSESTAQKTKPADRTGEPQQKR